MNHKAKDHDALQSHNVLIASFVFLFSIASYFFIHSNVVLFRAINLLASAAHAYFVVLAARHTTLPNVATSLLFFALSIVLKFPVEFA